MSSRRWTRSLRRAGGLVLAAAFALSAGTAPLTMVSCPWHQVGVRAVGPEPHESATGQHAMAETARTEESPGDAPHSHDGPCGCLGTCAPGLGYASVAPAASQVLPARLLSRVRNILPDRARPHATRERWFLPYPNGPPAAA